jgi:hypothetical protein
MCVQESCTKPTQGKAYAGRKLCQGMYLRGCGPGLVGSVSVRGDVDVSTCSTVEMTP